MTLVQVPARKAIIFFLLVNLTSCMTLHHGFIRNTRILEEKLGIIPDIDSSVNRLCAKKKSLIEKAATLSSGLPDKHTVAIPPGQLNNLFDNLQENISTDSMLFALARNKSSREAVVCLLESADAYDHYFRENRQLRRTINRGNSANSIPKGLLNKSQRFLLSPSVRKPVKSVASADSIKPASFLSLMGFNLCRHGDRINEAGYDILNGLSGVFGNTIGAFNRKPGYPADQEQLAAMLQPLDIILLKSTSHMTDKFIPGFFGHAAIYTGTRQFLESSGIWNLPDVIRHHREIDEGKVFAEGLRSGLQLSDINRFMDGEIYLIIRLPESANGRKTDIYRRIYSNMGKKYDFNFDVNSPDRIFCSELVYLVFDYLNWLTHKAWGRMTITPDEIARSVPLNPGMQFTGLITPSGIIAFPTAEEIFRLMKE